MPSVPPGLRGALNASEPATQATPLQGKLIGPASQVDTASQLVGYWYAVEANGRAVSVWRPGLFVKSSVAFGGEKEAVSVPAGALLYHQGRALVYVVVSDTSAKSMQFKRREVTVLGHEGDRVIVAKPPPERDFTGLAAGDEVVAKYPQILLSTEFRPDVDPD